MQLKIGHLYPDLLNLYGDRGNLLCWQFRLRARGLDAEICPISIGDSFRPEDYDLLFMGGGQDREQSLLYSDWLRKGEVLLPALEGGLPMLAICGAYQLLGKAYVEAGGKRIEGIHFFDLETVSGEGRLIGNLVAESAFLAEQGLDPLLVGFENHGGRTHLGATATPLAKVISGAGNNGEDGTEGAIREHTLGTYCHGSFLPKNPQVADLFLQWALERRGEAARLTALDDRLEQKLRLQLKGLKH